MPWPEKQRRAIYLRTKRDKGEKAAKELMHEAGYGGKKKVKPKPKKKVRRRPPAFMRKGEVRR
jgi:hypothetical protein